MTTETQLKQAAQRIEQMDRELSEFRAKWEPRKLNLLNNAILRIWDTEKS
jgi:transcription termination factor NusB